MSPRYSQQSPLILPALVQASSHDDTLRYRLVNVLGAVVLFILTLPVLLLGMLLTRCISPGPIIFRQSRMGRNGELFTIYKLRSMDVDAEKSGAVWAKESDERVGVIGRFLRSSRIDELPQFLNVVKGDMNIIGPRPERPEFFDKLCYEIPGYYNRLAVRPGLTGWAQVNNGYADSIDASRLKQHYDMFYIENWSWQLDLNIALRTIGVIVSGHGAR